jgi:hypothetical protein
MAGAERTEEREEGRNPHQPATVSLSEFQNNKKKSLPHKIILARCSTMQKF